MIEALAAALFGLIIGSFLNVCIYRLPRDLSVAKPARSFCHACKKTIAWYDNLPVASYLLLGGKCRNCQARIPLRYPIVELLTGVLFFWCVYSRGWTLLAFKLCLFSAIIVDLVFTDLEERILPDEFTKGGALAGLLLAPFTPPPSSLVTIFAPLLKPWQHSLAESALGAAASAALLWVTGFVYKLVRKREGLGFGDVKMLLTVGAFLGLPGALLTVFVGSVVGAIIGGLFIWLAGEDSTYELPFGTFLGAAALIVALLPALF